MNAMTVSLHGNAEGSSQSLLFLSYYNLREGMPLDCEICAENDMGEDNVVEEEEIEYVMCPDSSYFIHA